LLSPSAKREWIEIEHDARCIYSDFVSLCEEGVD